MKHHIQYLSVLTASVLLISACSQQPSIPEAGSGPGSTNGGTNTANGAGSNTRGADMASGGNVAVTGGGGGYPSAHNTGAAHAGNNGKSSSADAAITPENLDNPHSPLYQKIIYFDYNQATVKPQYQKILDAHAKLLASHPELRVRLEGHADERGTREYNIALSEERAKAVQWLMRSQGVKGSQTEIIAYGEERPAVVGEGEQSWAKNRRVEIRYLGR